MNRERNQHFWDGEKYRFPEHHEIETDRYYDTYRDLENNTPIQNLISFDFTGFQDKNGKDIYENDLLKGIFSVKTGEQTTTYKRRKSTYAVYSNIEVTGVVKMISGCWYFDSDFKIEYKTGFWAGLGNTQAEKRANEIRTTYSDVKELLYKVLEKVEIVGSVHETPELLTTKEK